jgi:hypothetical protein
MPTDVIAQLQESKLRVLEELIDSFQAALASGGGQEQAGAVADFMVDEGIAVRQGLLHLWDYHWTMALAGKVPDRRESGAKLRSLLERGARSLARGAAQARAFADFSGHPVARLAQFEQQAQTFPLWTQECLGRWALLDRPPKPLDRARLTQAQAAYERGECEEAADILARLEQGGPLVQE